MSNSTLYVSIHRKGSEQTQLDTYTGLPPVYDLSKIEFERNTRAENGTLMAISDDIAVVGINAPNRDVYQTEGFRLPTFSEGEYVRTRGGKVTEMYYYPGKSDFLKYGWYSENSEDTTHPVMQKTPLSMQRHAFYDLFGNVEEWTHTSLDGLIPSALPQIQWSRSVTTHGGNYSSGVWMVYGRSAVFNRLGTYPRPMIGLRVARTLVTKSK